VISFGFGGTNAHVILEQYKRPSESIHENTNSSAFTPFVFSAASGKSLYVYLATLSAFLRGASDMAMSLRDLAYTLYSRRSHLQIGITIAASNVNDLCNKIEEEIEHSRVNRNQELGRRPLPQSSPTKRPCILGIFTGQGAQWARMGAELVETSDTARRVIESLERRLSQLPDEDRPSWSLLEELQKDDSMSQINHAELSQPLCTAIQILQVDMLHAAGIEFSAVVGHSSGEIGAAYAAGFISAGDAICIAYYRGVCSRLAQEQPGAMMAVESTVEDIQELCQSRHFKGRVNIAAINSPTSQTVSGNKDSILKLQAILQDENKFAKILKVDKAYHSHHMNACSEKYLSALSALDIKAKTEGKCVWVSSVHQGRERAWDNEILQGKYWNKNLVRPVLFMEAIRSAWTSQGPFDLAIEVGPHPALKNSVLQTINNISGQEIPYTALFHRTRNPIQTVADSLGFLWSHLGKGHVNFHAYDIFISGTRAPPCRLIKGLPTYAWNHENEYWYESRYARAERQRSDPVHQLLGHITPNSTERETRWRNILRSEEIPWLKGHCLQGQIVFPAAGYVVLALEAALRVCKHIPVSIVEISDLELGKALTFDQSDTNVEAVFSLTGIQETGDKVIDANFTYSAAEKSSDSLTLRAGGSIRIWLGENSTSVLPPKGPQPSNSLEIPSDYFYDSLGKLNYQYSGPFKALTNLKRRLGYATGSISNLDTTEMLLHPAILDAAFQSTFLARSAPFDGSIWAMHVPKSIRKVRINPVLCASQAAKLEALSFISVQPVDSCILMGDVDIYPMFSENAMIQVEGLEVRVYFLLLSTQWIFLQANKKTSVRYFKLNSSPPNFKRSPVSILDILTYDNQVYSILFAEC
jgi:hybrid polyketide synthase/nonribosomal peptide synthetase ACE1